MKTIWIRVAGTILGRLRTRTMWGMEAVGVRRSGSLWSVISGATRVIVRTKSTLGLRDYLDDCHGRNRSFRGSMLCDKTKGCVRLQTLTHRSIPHARILFLLNIGCVSYSLHSISSLHRYLTLDYRVLACIFLLVVGSALV